MSESPDVLTKLGAARTRLILEKPFIGALVMHLPLIEADRDWCRTIATDARAFYFNPEYIARLDFAQAQFVLAHEALHCALRHFARRSHRTSRRWDIAADHAVNLLLIDDGLKPPPGALADPRFRGLSAEEIYPLIPPDAAQPTLDRHVFEECGTTAAVQASDGGGHDNRTHFARSAPPGPGAREGEALARQWQGRMAAAAQQARQAGRLAESGLRQLDRLIGPRLPWRQLLARYMMSAARDDYSFQRPSRREGDALLPRLASGSVEVHVVLDTSGSIGDEALAEFAAEVDALKAQIRARVTLHACDARLDARGPWIYQPWEPLVLPGNLRGGGGTSFAPPFEWIAAAGERPDLLVYFTDAEGDFPPRAPGFPVVWLVQGRARVPWGERIQLN
ncbi:MAG TPA: VWA-like domain-containing protein [Burkholderiales bacterium]|nr:VWA-like domain-containing protein [Burkholderiales bacterium]